jgi:outer membrane protein assembly factor BamE (lipoprotein component of BamABCDE complex)
MKLSLIFSFLCLAIFLEARVDSIQELQTEKINNQAGAAGTRANWRRLKVGMSEAEVSSTLGEPQRVSVQILIIWYYGTGNVYFDRNGSLMGWTEPL